VAVSEEEINKTGPDIQKPPLTPDVQKARGHRDIRTTLVYTQVVVDPRLAEAVQKAFTLRPKPRTRVATSRGKTGKSLIRRIRSGLGARYAWPPRVFACSIAIWFTCDSARAPDAPSIALTAMS
jgi:hypothetical protein